MTTVTETTDLRVRYVAAERLLPDRWKELVFSGRVRPNWIGGGDRFWYENTTREGTEFLLVDPAVGSREPAFDHGGMAQALSAALGRAVRAQRLPIDGLEMRAGEPLRLHVEGKTWIWNPSDAALRPAPEPAPRPLLDSVSSDGRLSVSIRNHNLVLRERATGAERLLTQDGVEACPYGTQPDISSYRHTFDLLGLRMPPAVAWSPDSRQLVTSRIDQQTLPYMYYVQSTPPDGGRPRLFSERYAMPGEDVIQTAHLILIDVESGEIVEAEGPPLNVPFMSPITHKHVWWAADGGRVYFLAGERADRVMRLCALDPNSGATSVLVEEGSDTQVQVNPIAFNRPNVHVLASGETIWWSERSGWGHLYLYGVDGSVRPLTQGEWFVRDLIAVDERARVVLFTAAGREPGLDPYACQLYRMDLDGDEVQRLTDDILDHAATASPSGRYIVDTTSWVDTPEKSCVRDNTGAISVELESADTELLYATGWTPQERFTVKAADGVTDLYGILYRPHQFDPDAHYPILDDIYPGPQINAVPVRFLERGTATHAASMAALGFAVVVVDGRGTPLRGKVFQEHCRGEHDADYLDDHIAAIRQLGATRPWLDIDRVGIYGHSGGGRASTAALFRHPDFFKVAVSLSGNHDDRLNHPTWSEKYIGDIDVADYTAHANPTHAEGLAGKLLLIHGELDNNVHPSMTLRLVDALIAANKDFDLLIVPNADHMMVVHQSYWLRRRWDYFVQHLLGEVPPVYRIADLRLNLDALHELLG